MARYDSFIKFNGTMGGLTFTVDAHGQGHVKAKNRKYDIKQPGTLRNNNEFGGGSNMGKAFRYSFLKVSKQFTERSTCGRLNGVFRLVIQEGPGALGERLCDLKSHPDYLLGFQFEKFRSVREVLTDGLLHLEINSSRDMVRWQVPEFVPRTHVKAPDFSTHFQLVLVGTQVSQGRYDAQLKGYVETQPVNVMSAGMHWSAPMALDATHVDAFTLAVVPGKHIPVPDAMAVVVCAGVLFGTMVQGKFVAMKDGRALDILGVG